MTVSENDHFPLTDQQEKHLSIIFESVPTVLEEATLEEIFTKIGRLKNLNNFYVKLTCKEASDRLMAHKHLQKVSCHGSVNLLFKELIPFFWSAGAVISTVTE